MVEKMRPVDKANRQWRFKILYKDKSEVTNKRHVKGESETCEVSR